MYSICLQFYMSVDEKHFPHTRIILFFLLHHLHISHTRCHKTCNIEKRSKALLVSGCWWGWMSLYCVQSIYKSFLLRMLTSKPNIHGRYWEPHQYILLNQLNIFKTPDLPTHIKWGWPLQPYLIQKGNVTEVKMERDSTLTKPFH